MDSALNFHFQPRDQQANFSPPGPRKYFFDSSSSTEMFLILIDLVYHNMCSKIIRLNTQQIIICSHDYLPPSSPLARVSMTVASVG